MSLADMQSVHGGINPFGSNPSGRFTNSTINLGQRPDVYAGESIGGLYAGYTDNLPVIGVTNPSGRHITSTINLGERDVYAGEGIGGLYSGYTNHLPSTIATNPIGRHDVGWTSPVHPAQGPGGLSADIVTDGKAVAEMNGPILADVTPLSTVLEEQEF